MFQKHLSEVHNVSGPDAFDVHQKVSNQEFLDSIGIDPSVSIYSVFQSAEILTVHGNFEGL